MVDDSDVLLTVPLSRDAGEDKDVKASEKALMDVLREIAREPEAVQVHHQSIFAISLLPTRSFALSC